jgi:hypothetical protein
MKYNLTSSNIFENPSKFYEEKALELLSYNNDTLNCAELATAAKCFANTAIAKKMGQLGWRLWSVVRAMRLVREARACQVERRTTGGVEIIKVAAGEAERRNLHC